MEKQLLKKLHTFLTISVCLYIICITQAIAAGTLLRNTIPDSEKTMDCSLVSPTIQDAINQAPAHATLYLPAGTYNETLTINKPLHLKGEGISSTFISTISAQNGYAILISAKEVTISDIDLTNQGAGLYTTCIKIIAPNTTIQNCSFHDTPIGLAIWSSHNTIAGCEFRNCDDEGIVLLGTPTTASSNNTITSSNFYENCDGIELQYATNNLITCCMFTHNTHAGIDAIICNNNNNIISHCKFTNNVAFGLYVARSAYNLITQCSFSDDLITFIQASENTLLESQIKHVHLLDDSSLYIEQCEGFTLSDILSQQSSFEIQVNQPENMSQEKKTQTTIHFPFLLTLCSRFAILKQFFLSNLYNLFLSP
ncbi:hypothetical protein AYK25_09375 [Thermoplasmatales archaeon SM1-50]|nr:MAG: hypothetical protein AYK25_09375 [Thermoplasmatales archaeon SM1-50]